MIYILGSISVLNNKTYLVRNLCESNATKNNSVSRPKKETFSIEEPTTCCMSGCANCVWLDYADKLSEYFKDGGEKALKEINEKVSDPNIKTFLLHELRMRSKT